MPDLQIHCETISVPAQSGPDIVNITGQLNSIIEKERFQTGILNVFVAGSTGSVTTVEFEPGAVEDLKRAIIALAPPGLSYRHELAWRDGNGHSHVQAALLGPSVSLPVRDGRLETGVWQQVVLINHDIKLRKRKLEISLIGQRRA